MIGNNAICYEAVQRILRNRLVDYVRLRMTELYPSDHLERLKKPFEKEWDILVSNAKACRDLGGTDTKVRDDHDLLSVGHFYNIFDTLFDKMFSAAAIATGNILNLTSRAGKLMLLDSRVTYSRASDHPRSARDAFESPSVDH